MITRTCIRCNIPKPINRFGFQTSAKRHRRNVCLDCRNGRQRKNQVLPPLNSLETFVSIMGTNGLYKIGDLGTVLSFAVDRIRKEHYIILRPLIGPKKYRFVYIWINKKRKIVKPHRLVGIHFIPNPLNKPQINHKDGDKGNNAKSNLEWNTQSENMQHAHRLGLRNLVKGVGHHKNKLTEKQVIEIFNSTGRESDIASIYNIAATTVGNIRRGKIWSHLTNKTYKQKSFYAKHNRAA